MAQASIKVVDSLANINPSDWNRLAAGDPFLSHEFLHALHETGCAAPRTGWVPRYLTLWEEGGQAGVETAAITPAQAPCPAPGREKFSNAPAGARLTGAMPLYLKGHSRGEFVFDYAWADALERHGMAYYPKLLSAVPFTPVSGARLMSADPLARRLLARAAIELARTLEVSSLHVLFPHARDLGTLRESSLMVREGVQFHWRNAGYAGFDEFLAAMNQEKRKKIRQERRRMAEAGVRFRCVRGAAIEDAELRFFYRCYVETYRNHGSSPYLSLDFFMRLRAVLPDAMLLVIAERDEQPIASALNVIGESILYGRYWGTLQFVSGLHFETCYLQAIDYCIEHRIARFEGGAQGVHKIARGLVPTPTWSAHWVADRRFAHAIAAFLEREQAGVALQIAELETHTPLKAAESECRAARLPRVKSPAPGAKGRARRTEVP